MRTFQGTFHARPDYALWYGWSEMQRDLTEIKELAAQMRRGETWGVSEAGGEMHDARLAVLHGRLGRGVEGHGFTRAAMAATAMGFGP